jgi:hypothetical protein
MSDLINIIHTVSRIRQPTKNSCWAACIAMLSGGVGMSKNKVDEVIKIAKKHDVKLTSDGALIKEKENMTKLASAFEITISITNDSVHVQHFVEVLNRAPIILFGSFMFEQPSPFFHAVVLSGMWGDGGNTTCVNIIDPLNTLNGNDSTNDYITNWEDLCNNVLLKLDFVGYKK